MTEARTFAASNPGAPRRIVAAIATLIAAALYLPTASRAIGFIDRGELAAVASTLGIAHPTGYPTFTLLGAMVTRIVPLRPVVALNLFAALLVAAGIGVLVCLLDHVLASLPPRGGMAADPPWPRALTAGLGALATGATGIWWQQANGFEVYALQALLLPLVCLTFVRFVDGPPMATIAETARRGSGFAFVLGLAFTNHLTTILLAPAFLTYYVLRLGWRGVPRLPALAPAFLLGLTPYAYLPLRSALQPRFDWGNPEEPWRLWSHVTARQYQTWMFSSWDVARQQLRFLADRLPAEWVYLGMALVAVGAWWLLRRDPRRALWVGLVFATALVAIEGYAIRDIDSYAMPLVMMLGIAWAVGLSRIREWLGLRLGLTLGAILVLGAVVLHARAADEHRNTLVEDFARNVLDSLPERAVLFSSQWDCLVSASYYLQAVERLRPDVTIVNPELMRRSWYVRELERREPELGAAVRADAEHFVREVAPFERGLVYESSRIESAYVGMLTAVVERARERRPVAVTYELADARWARGVRVPRGLGIEIRSDSAYVPASLPSILYRPWRNRADFYVALIARSYAEALVARAVYERAHGYPDRARAWALRALDFAPWFRRRDIPTQPLDAGEITTETLEYFAAVRRFVEGP